METKELAVIAPPSGDEKSIEVRSEDSPVFVDTYGGRVHVQWDRDAAVTPFGQLPFFIDFLKTAELFGPWVEESPLVYTSPNAPKKVNVLGTLFLSVLAGHTRYAHVDSVRYDTVNPALLGMDTVASASSVRRAFLGADGEACACWLRRHLHRCYDALFFEPWILDVDTTVKLLYGHQEGAVLGYNPKKPGRPSHVLHTYFMANTRLVLDVGTLDLRVAELSKLRDQLSERGVSLWAVLSESAQTERTAQNLGLATRLSKPHLSEVPAVSAQVLPEGAAKWVKGPLRSGGKVAYDGNVVVLGDVNSGAEIVAGGSIIVWGRLRGVVHAGAQGDESAVVCALELAPTQLRIAGEIAVSPKKQGKTQPEVARLLEGHLVAQPWNAPTGK